MSRLVGRFAILFVVWAVAGGAVESECSTLAARSGRQYGDEADAADAVVSQWVSTRSIIRKCERALSADADPMVLKNIGGAYLAHTFSSAANREDLVTVLGSELGGLTDREIRLCVGSYLSALNYTSTSTRPQKKTGGGVSGAPTDDCGNSCQCDEAPICCGTDYCACSCDPEGGICSPYCEPSCFPGSATAVTADGSTRAMSELRIGDRVLVRYADGSIGFDDIYLFTHKKQDVAREFVELSTESGHRLVATAGHFIPISDDVGSCEWSRMQMVLVAEVSTGSSVWVVDDEGPRCSVVVHKAQRHDVGIFNPLTLSGTIVVNGVLASAHSDWVLHGMVSVSWEHSVYQLMFAPVRVLYRIIGASWVERLAEEWKIVDILRSSIDSKIRLCFIEDGLKC